MCGVLGNQFTIDQLSLKHGNICYLQNKCVDFHINEVLSTSSFGKKKVSASSISS